MSKVISAGKTPKIKIDSIDGDLSVVGWDGEDVLIKTDEDELSLKHNGDEIVFFLHRRCFASYPEKCFSGHSTGGRRCCPARCDGQRRDQGS